MCWHCHIPCEGQNLADLKTTVITREIRIRYCGVLRTKSRLPVLGRWKEYYWDGATWGFIPAPNWPNCKVRGHSLQGCLHFWHQLQVSGFPETTVSFHSLLEGLTELTENYIHGYSLLLGKVYRLNSAKGRDAWSRIWERSMHEVPLFFPCGVRTHYLPSIDVWHAKYCQPGKLASAVFSFYWGRSISMIDWLPMWWPQLQCDSNPPP